MPKKQLIYQSDNYKQQAAGRLLKLLMIARVNKIPLHIVDQLRWDLGLPQDYTQTIVPEFPDYFRVTGANDSLLELVCWSNDLAVSVLEKNAMKRVVGYEKGMPITFSLQYSRGFEIDKKFKKWVDEWQKLPYISPYENASHLPPKSDESDKWAVAILHELLHLFVPKKTERENILCLGEYLGIRSRFKRALLHHPGIFYLSSKIGTHTVVLKEAYKRDLLIEKHPLMGMRYKYIHLMNTVKEDHKPKSVQGGRTKQQKTPHDFKGGEGEGENGESGEERDGKLPGTSDFEFEDDSDDCDYDDDDEEEEEEEEEENEDESYIVAHKNVAANRGRTTRKTNFQEKRPMRNAPRRLAGGRPNKTNDRSPPKFSRRAEKDADRDVRGRKLERSGIARTRGRSISPLLTLFPI
ncbi:hypothetical protein F0562_028210 [Nyssa sinensis]|uniref:PORR domain-containing protein n=1 Tax=Nyssa sinensis TaxID=561372 RepID=A0A5J5B8E3_9ASTE|nr:hypothetical protein F0562_028210 [Nyssa sinensis]